MKKTVIIKCSKCHKKTEGLDMSFDELAVSAGWKKNGKYYNCPDCSGTKKSKREKPFVNYGQEDN